MYTKQHKMWWQYNHYTNGIQKKVKWLIWICIHITKYVYYHIVIVIYVEE